MASPAPTRSAHRRASSLERAELLEWVERVATFFQNQYGLPPITGRIFGWLLVCDPPEQSGAEIAAAIGASRASITTNMRLLTAGGLARRFTRPGERTAYYVFDDEALERAIRRRIDQMMAFSEITADAIEMLSGTGERADRVRSAHATFEWFTDVLLGAPPMPKPTGRRR